MILSVGALHAKTAGKQRANLIPLIGENDNTDVTASVSHFTSYAVCMRLRLSVNDMIRASEEPRDIAQSSNTATRVFPNEDRSIVHQISIASRARVVQVEFEITVGRSFQLLEVAPIHQPSISIFAMEKKFFPSSREDRHLAEIFKKIDGLLLTNYEVRIV